MTSKREEAYLAKAGNDEALVQSATTKRTYPASAELRDPR